LGGKTDEIIFLSSIAVYGEDKRENPVIVTDSIRPENQYGKSKMICEKNILDSTIKNCTILRLSPVYDEKNLMDIHKRVFLPGSKKIKMILNPPPKYSFTKIDTISDRILKLLSKGSNGQVIYNISDLRPYCQNEIAKWFHGVELTIPVPLTKPLYWLSHLMIPKKYGYKIRCNYWKLFCNNIYIN